MKRTVTIFILLFCLVNIKCQIIFNHRLFTDSLNLNNKFGRSNAILHASDSAYLVVGTSATGTEMSAVYLDKYGDKIWSYSTDLGKPYSCRFYEALETRDGNFVLVGDGTDTSTLYQNAVFVKLNKVTGDTIWSRQSGLPDTSLSYKRLKQTSDNGFVFCGYRATRDSLGLLHSDVYLVKRDSIGAIKWERSFDLNIYDAGNAIEIASDGGFLTLGNTYDYDTDQRSMYLVKTDSLGNFEWQKTYGGVLKGYGYSICKLIDGNYALAGKIDLDAIKAAGFILKINPAGEIIWQKKYFGSFDRQEFSALKQLKGGELVVCGNALGDTIGSIYFGIIKVLNETDGSTIWERQYQYYNKLNTDQYFYNMDLCLDGGFVLAGMVRNWNPGEGPGNAMWVVKTDCMGNDSIWDNAACPIKTDTPNTVIPFNLYPNPSTGAVTLDYFIPQNAENQSISFYDATGKLVQKVDFTGEGQIQLNIDCSGFSNGVYQCVLVSDGEVLQQGKLVVIN